MSDSKERGRVWKFFMGWSWRERREAFAMWLVKRLLKKDTPCFRREVIAEQLVTQILEWAIPDDSNTIQHALREMGPRPADDGEDGPSGNPDQWMHDHMLLMCRLFCLEGHSGFSASIARRWLHRLLAHKPLGPLTGEDDEWMTGHMLSDGAQNIRRSSIFRDPDGVAYDINGFVFREPPDPESESGYRSTWTGRESWKVVRFPYVVPNEPIVVDVPMEPTREQQIDALLAAGVPREDIYSLHNEGVSSQ